jgi:hypothetical protein
VGTPQIYPYNFLRARVYQWNFLFALVCLGHIYIETIVWVSFTVK